MNKTNLVLSLLFLIGLGITLNNAGTKETVVAQNPTPVIEKMVPDAIIQPTPVVNSSKQEVKRLSLKSSNVVLVLDEIDESAVSIANEIGAKEKAGAKELYVLLNSPGGSVMDGALIVSAIEAAKIPIYTVNLQLCASMCAIIHSYGTKRYAVARSNLMYHPAAAGVQGSVPQMMSRLTWINNYVNKMDAYIAHRAGIKPEDFLRELNNELWLDAEDATARNFNDGIVSVDLQLDKPTLSILESVSRKMKDRLAISLE